MILAGLFMLVTGQAPPVAESLAPFFSGGAIGLVGTMGLTFIALQGFEIIATVAGEVDQPERRVPRAMFLSLAIAIAVYIPLLFVIMTAGVPEGGHISELAKRNPETLFALAVENYLGAPGYWVVLIVAIMATLSALHANLLAASRIALRMAQDRTLPWVLGIEHPKHGTPAAALYASALAIAALLMMTGDLASAGAAASLIFLVSFVFAHGAAYLARSRGLERENAYRSPAFPLVPIAGGLACAALALFQAVTVMQAGVIALVWLGIGALLYLSLFGRRAEVADAAVAAQDSELSKLRGSDPILLVPISNPANAASLAQVASAMLPPKAGRLWLLSIVPSALATTSGRSRLEDSQLALSNALLASVTTGRRPEGLISIGDEPWDAIRRAAQARGCGALLLGLGNIDVPETQQAIDGLLARLSCDLAVLRAPEGFDLPSVRRLVVPLRADVGHDPLRARLIAGLQRVCGAEVVYLTMLSSGSSDAEVVQTERSLSRLCEDEVRGGRSIVVERGEGLVDAIIAHTDDSSLVFMALSRLGRRQQVFGELGIEVARRSRGSLLLVGKG